MPGECKKIIMISQRVDEVKEYGEIRDSLDEQWHKLFQKMNAVLLPVPNVPENQELLLNRVKPDAIVLTGGNTPVMYGGAAPQRDKTDEALIKLAVERGIPLLGVCRGMQSVALYFGGSLKRVEGHVATRHMIYGEISREVNSYHSYAVGQVGNELQILAKDENGSIEAIKHRRCAIYGIMWHPEREKGFQIEDINMIKELLLV